MNIGGSNHTNVQYTNIDSQVKFIDTIKYYQQSLASLAKSVDQTEKSRIRSSRQKFIEKSPTYSGNFSSLSGENKEWVLEYLSGGKGVIPYEKIKSHEYLNCVPEGKYFSKSEFYSSLKSEIISDQDYENVKKFWKLLHLTKLSDLNDIYNFQNTIILCEISGNRATEIMRKFPYNPRKCSLASSLSGCIHRFLSKAVIALPTQADIVDIFVRILIGGFSCVNTRLSFDSKILLPKEDQKLIYKIKNLQEN